MTKIKLFLLTIAIAFISNNLMAQTYSLDKANKLFSQLSYTPAIEWYKKGLQKNNDFQAMANLAECYLKTNDAVNAAKIYEKVVQSSSAKPVHIYNYAQSLMEIKNIKEAKTQFSKYLSLIPNDVKSINAIKACDNYLSFFKDSAMYKIKSMPFNSDKSDISPIYYQNGLLYASDKGIGTSVKLKYSWTGNGFYNLYFVDKNGTNYNSTSTLFTGKANTKFHDAVPTFSNDENEIYFTRDNYYSKLEYSTDKISKLKIYHQKRDAGGNWSSAEEFAYNGNEFSTGHPSLSSDGQFLYFASDRPGGFGGTDIYVCKKELSGWGAPQNLGAQINTSGNEMFPFIAKNNTLYFASNGLKGMGGLDIYSTTISNGKSISSPDNIGFPLNSSEDDFSLITDNTGNEGFFTSHRAGSDDIYSFVKNCVPQNVVVFDAKTLKPIEGAIVNVVNKNGSKQEKTTDDNGRFSLCLTEKSEYEFIANKSNYIENRILLNASNLISELPELKIPLSQIEEKKELAIVLKGKVFRASDSKTLEGYLVKLVNFCTGKEEQVLTDLNGEYSFNLKPNCNYRVAVSSPNCGLNFYDKSTMGITTSQTFIQDFSMLCVGDVLKIDDIHYDLDKSYIRPDAAAVLDRNAMVFYKYPTMRVELRSHTDCRAPNAYNLALSQRRASSAVNYLVKLGLASNRFVAKGYGETMLLNKCADGAKCTEEEHQANRRTEFKILGF
jgi:outer membrane protein OmpA-like peptidoglycan-associated protein